MEPVIRFFQPPSQSYFLFGARGVGKSTWIHSFYSAARFIELLDPEQYWSYQAFPSRLKEFVYAHQDSKIFVLDEIQRVPHLLSVVHALIEEKRNWSFILTGSSARKLKRQGIDLLAGRAQLKYLHPFMAAELKENFDLVKALKYGLLPLIYESDDPQGVLKAYVALYMKEEVQAEGIVRNIEQFGRFLQAISFSQSAILNYTNIARECAVSSKTVETYTSILEDLLLAFKISVFNKKAQRHLSSHPKFYFFDVGVYTAIRPKGPLDKPEEIIGHAIESLVAQHLRAWLDYSKKSGELFFWRTKSGLEIDFIVYGEIGFYAIEVKSTRQISLQDLRALKEFKKDYPECRSILIYGGQDKLMRDDILCYPLKEFLLNLVPDKECGARD
jgi:uncharacterized protein